MKYVSHDMTALSGKTFTLKAPEPRDSRPSTFLVAGHKTGSTLLSRVVTEMCERADIPCVNVELSLWRQGISIPEWPEELFEFLRRPGYVFASFRSLQKLPDYDYFANGPKIFLVRDPRDVAVSFYFSMLESHTSPKAGGSTADNLKYARRTAQQNNIDEYVLNDKCDAVLKNIERFCAYADDKDSTFYRYEDIIFSKKEWVAQLAQKLGADLPQTELDEIADKNDIRPEKEDSSQHIRQVTPGNYKKHLSEKAANYLIEKYKPIYEHFYCDGNSLDPK